MPFKGLTDIEGSYYNNILGQPPMSVEAMKGSSIQQLIYVFLSPPHLSFCLIS